MFVNRSAPQLLRCFSEALGYRGLSNQTSLFQAQQELAQRIKGLNAAVDLRREAEAQWSDATEAMVAAYLKDRHSTEFTEAQVRTSACLKTLMDKAQEEQAASESVAETQRKIYLIDESWE